MIFSRGSKGPSSSSPIDLTAILINSLFATPVDRFCFFKKYLPASSMAFRGTSPTSSEPLTRMPRASAFLHTSSKATCTGVMEILVRFMEICATPYSSINQPMALTSFSEPGVITWFPSASFTSLPVIGSPSRFVRPRSLTSKAMALARRVEVVLRFIL